MSCLILFTGIVCLASAAVIWVVRWARRGQ